MPVRRATALALALLAPASAWDSCEFADMPYFVIDEGVGISFAYAIAAINGTMYSGGYSKGNFVYKGVTAEGDVNPSPDSTMMFSSTTSNIQNLFVAAVDDHGSQQQIWPMYGSAIQKGDIGHGPQTNSIAPDTGIEAMKDNKHLAVHGGFQQLLTMPDGTVLNSAVPDPRKNKGQVQFVMKLDVSKKNGIGAGTTGWVKIPDVDFLPGTATNPIEGGAYVSSVTGDADGNMLVGWYGCFKWTAYDPIQYDSRGRPRYGFASDCQNFITKLNAADGSVAYNINLGGDSVSSAQLAATGLADGTFYAAWSMRSSFGNTTFGLDANGHNVTVEQKSAHVGLVKYTGDGHPVWAKVTAPTTFYQVSVSTDGTTLAVIGSKGCTSGRCRTNTVSRISTDDATAGDVLWADSSAGVGSHGLRGVSVTDTSDEVFVFGQVTGQETLTDSLGATTTFTTHGSYDIFVAAFSQAGVGKYTTHGGGTGMEYFFAMAVDPMTDAIYVGGNTRSEKITWGEITRNNPMYNGDAGENNPDTSSAVGSSKAIVIKIKTTDTLPSCLNTCTPSQGVQPSDVKNDYCYIDGRCYPSGKHSSYEGRECLYCKPDSGETNSAVSWYSVPDTSEHCYMPFKFNSKWCVDEGTHKEVYNSSSRKWYTDYCSVCRTSESTDSWSTQTGCVLLDRETGVMKEPFYAGVYMTTGAMTMSMAELEVQEAEQATSIEALTLQVNTLTAQKSSLEQQLAVEKAKTCPKDQTTKVAELEAELAVSQAQMAAKTCDEGFNEATAIALIAVLAAVFVLVAIILMVVIQKEKKGTPIFYKVGPSKAGGATYTSNESKA